MLTAAASAAATEPSEAGELFLGMISLRTCPERRAFFKNGWKEQARKYLPATASEAEVQDPSFLGAKMYYHVADLDPDEGGVQLGCTRSHMAVYEKAVECKNAKAAIVFEDGVKVNGHFTPSVIKDCLALMDTWDVIHFHKTGVCKIHGCLSANLFHTSNLGGRRAAYMISRPLMEYVLRFGFDSKEVVPYTHLLPKASARHLTYHPSLITEGAFGSWNGTRGFGFGRPAGTAKEDDERIGKYDNRVGNRICPRRLAVQGVHYFGYVKTLRKLVLGREAEYADSEDLTVEKSVAGGMKSDYPATHLLAVERAQLARREERTGLGFDYHAPSKLGARAGALPAKFPRFKGDTTVVTTEDSDFDVIIVGAGVAGSSCAFTLANAGAKVLLVDQWDVVNENRRRLVADVEVGGEDYFESMGSSRGGPRRIGTLDLDLFPSTRVSEAWTAWCDMAAVQASRTRVAESKENTTPPLLDVIGEVWVLDIFPFGWLLLIVFPIWRVCRRIFFGEESLPREVELLWSREQLLSRLPKDAFQFRSANVFGIYSSDAAALYTKEILKYFQAEAVPLCLGKLDEIVRGGKGNKIKNNRNRGDEETSSTEGPAGVGQAVERQQDEMKKASASAAESSNYSILGNTKVVNVRKVPSSGGAAAMVLVDCVENLAAASFDAEHRNTASCADARKKPTTAALRAKHVVITGGGWAGELLKKMGFDTARTKIGVFTCPSYNVNVVKCRGDVPPLSVENKCPIFAFPAAQIYGFPMASRHDGHQVMSIRPNYPATWCQDPENHTKFDEHLEVVDGFVTEYIQQDALVPTSTASSDSVVRHSTHHQALNHTPLNSYTCRYPQLAVDGKNFGPVMDFVPGYDNRVVLAAGFDGYGFKYGSLYGKEVLDLLVTHRRVPGLEWEKKPVDNNNIGGKKADSNLMKFPMQHCPHFVFAAVWAYFFCSSSPASGNYRAMVALFMALVMLNVAYAVVLVSSLARYGRFPTNYIYFKRRLLHLYSGGSAYN
eukprot:g7386.t1